MQLRTRSLVPVLLALLCLTTTAATAWTPPDADIAQQTAGALITRVAAHAGAPGGIAAWADGTPGTAMPVWSLGVDAPIELLVPVIDPAGVTRGFVGLDPESGSWRWYAESAITWVQESEARELLAAQTGQASTTVHPRLHQMPDKGYYWRLVWQDAGGQAHTAYLDATDRARFFVDEAAASAGLLTPAHNPAPPRRAEGPAETGARTALQAPPELRYPSEYQIAGVPHYYQNTSYNCGPASLQMVFDYWGEPIAQGEIKRAANCTNPNGTYADDMVRAGHFSIISSSIIRPDEYGYLLRPFGYATMQIFWSDPPHYDTRYSDLKDLVSSDIPILLLTWFGSAHQYGHYRNIIGYSDPLDIFIVHDPWETIGPDYQFSQAYLVDDLWDYYSRWAITSQPWTFEITVPESVEADAELTVSAEVFYPGAHPFESQYPASNPQAVLRLPPELSFAVGEDSSQAIAGLTSSASSGVVSWQVVAGSDPATAVFSIHATGRVYGYTYSYGNYEDDIGGVGRDSLVIEADPGAVGDPDLSGPRAVILRACGPNPCTREAAIRFTLSRDERVRLSVLDAAGRQVAALVDRPVAAGEHLVPWEVAPETGGPAVGSGVYYVLLETARGARAMERLVVVR
jgi:hypothetical protein